MTSVCAIAVYTSSINFASANAANNSPKVFTNNHAPSASSGGMNNMKKTEGTYLNKTIEILSKDLVNSSNNNTNETSKMTSSIVKTIIDERKIPVKSQVSNSSESTTNNSTKISSEVPQTSAQRQTPNNSFGSMIVK